MSKEKQPKSNQIKIKSVRTYQPVEFNTKLETFFSAERPHMKDVEITFDPDLQLLIIKGTKDVKMAVPANIAWMAPLEV